jgi:hypothetical protein
MSNNDAHLPGYSLEDDPQPHPLPPTESLTVEPVPNVSDTVVVTTTTPPDVAQPQPLTQEYISISPEPEELPAVDEFADPKIAQLHAIFPDFDAAIL